MPLSRILELGFLTVSVAVVALFAPGAVRALRTHFGTGSRRQADATGRVPEEPDQDLIARIHILEGLGYRRLGETLTAIPGGAEPAWILVAEDAGSYAILVPGWASTTGLTGFYSAWPDGTWLGTLHPRGTPLVFRTLRLRIASASLGDAAAAHRVEAAQVASDHGTPVAVRTMADMLRLDADYRIRFGGRELRPLLVRALAPVAVGLVMTLLALVILTRP